MTITGAGGIGKSRIAVRVAERLATDHPGGAWFVELARTAGPSTVAEEIARRVGAPLVPGGVTEPLAERIARSGPCLVVLDNAEHVLVDVSSVVIELLDRCPELHVLVTSREPLGGRGEQVWRVPPMSSPALGGHRLAEDVERFDATRLFLDRMGSARFDPTIDLERATQLVTICTRLDGLPLALELAAARSRSLSLPWILAGLETALAVLDPDPSGSDRHQSLRASIAWSVDLLEPDHRAALGRLSVFRAPFTVDAAAAVVAPTEGTVAVLPRLIRLCDKSLVQFDPTAGRYHLLETIRDYGATVLLDDTLRAEAQARHCAWFARWCLEIGEGRHGIDRSAVLAEMPDVVAALDWARRHDPERAMQICVGLGAIRTTLGHHENLLATWEWLIAADGPARSAPWASAVASLMAAATGARLDVDAIVPAVEEHLAGHDERARGWLARGRAMVPAYRGDLEPIVAYSAAVIAREDDVEASVYLGFAAYMLALGGRLVDAGRLLRHLRLVTERHATRFSVDSVGNGFAAAVLVADLSGRPDAALRLGDGPPPQDPAFSMTAAAALAHVALRTGDHAALQRALDWGRRGTIPLLRFLGTELELARTLAAGDIPAASMAATTFWAQAVTVPLSRLHRVPVVLDALLADDRIDDARAVTREAAAIARGMTGVPWAETAVASAEARQARAEGRTDLQLAHARTMLGLAERFGFASVTEDALRLGARTPVR